MSEQEMESESKKPDYEALKKFIREEIAKEMNIPVGEVEDDLNFANMGISSIQGIQLSEALSKKVGREITGIDFFEYPSVNELAAFAVEDPEN